MNDSSSKADSGQFSAGFDFLQNLAKGATVGLPPIADLRHWVTPVFDVAALERRISELKAVHFWLEQNTKALSAAVQALEVQKMTLATLKSMNLNLGDLAENLRSAASTAAFTREAASKPSERAPAAEASSAPASGAKPPPESAQRPAAGLAADSLQLWGALMQQFQQIASDALAAAARPAQAGDTPAGNPQAAAKPRAASKAATPQARATRRRGA